MGETIEIVAEKNIFNDHILDIIGNEFKFNHEKGLAEWIKNSVDAYLRHDVEDSESHIILRFSDVDDILFECIDFVGMTVNDIENALKIWGDPEAAKRGMVKKVYGGHGNGGKFYMRQMFSKAYYITYRDGLLNVFGFNDKKKYGFAKGLREKKLSPDAAIKYSGLDAVDIPHNTKKEILAENTGFTIARGYSPRDMNKRRFNIGRLCDKIRHFPQARRILKYKPVTVYYNYELYMARLLPEDITTMAGFENVVEVDVPASVTIDDNGSSEQIHFVKEGYSPGKLKLFTSNEPLSRNGRLGDLNTIDIIGEIGVIATYKLQELGYINNLNAAEFIYGECTCPILEDTENDCVKNDRSILVDNNMTRELRKWISKQVDHLADKISENEKKEIQAKNIETLSDINKILNDWKNNFMEKVIREMLGGAGEGAGGGIGTGGTGGGSSTEKNRENKRDKGIGEGPQPGGGNTSKKPRQAFPKVLLSSIDTDPLTGHPLQLSERQEPVYQRTQDEVAGIYWINTSRKLAQYIIEKYGVKSTKWRDYHLQRIIDVICKEALYKLEKREPDNFTAAKVDGEIINTLIGKAHDSAIENLNVYLFEEKYKTPREELLERISSIRNLENGEKKKLLSEVEEAIALLKNKE